MFSKIIFVLATVCVINASVITVYDDDPVTDVANNPKDCNFQACDQLCRRLKFPGGACFNGRCKCDNFLNAEGNVSEENPTDLEDFISLKGDDPEIVVASNPKDCNFQACDQLCRRLKFPGGACVNGRCKCDNFLNAHDVKANPSRCNFKGCDSLCRSLNKGSGNCIKGRCKCDNPVIAEKQVPEESLSSLEDSVVQEDNNDIEAETKKSNCNNQACYQLCRRLKFPGGICINGRCKCDNFLNAEVTVLDDSLSNPEDSVSPKACRSDKCNELCIKIKLGGGACINGYCVCNKRLSQQGDEADSIEPDVEDSVTSRACNNKKCNQLCRKQKFRGGACLGANCYCNKFLSLQDDTMTDSVDTLSLHSCNSIRCDDQCRRSGWHSGVCINGQCKCDYFLNSEGAENSLTNFEDTLSPKRCTHEACNAFCRKLQFREGVCNGARCRCYNYNPTPKGAMNDFDEPLSLEYNFVNDNLLGAEVNAVEEYLKFATRRVCRLTKCNRTCTRRGYEGATCVKGRCKCYNITETSLPVSELSDNPTEHSCNMQACDQLCRKLKFPGGACVNGRCKCDNFLGIDVDAVDKNSELAMRRVCDLRRCNHTCTRRGYAGAKCVNGWCQCYDKIEREG